MINYEQLEQIQKKLQKNITAKRYRHTIGVQYTSISLAMRYGVDLDQAALAGLLHDCAKCLDDRYHTTGRPGMTLLEKIVFTADYIEPNRKLLEHLPSIRQMAFIDLDEAVYMILRDTVDYLGESDPDKENEIEHHTLEAYEYYRKLHEAANA